MEFRNAGSDSIKEIMWEVVKIISDKKDTCGIAPSYEPRMGYFEFAVSARTSAIRFI